MVRCQCGFTLIEVLVAFSITAVTLGILFQIYAKGTTAAILAEEYAEALAIAESKLAGVSVNDAIPGYDLQGTTQDNYDWELRLEDYLDNNRETDPSSLFSLVSVDVNVSWHSQGRLHRVDLQILKPIIRPGNDDQ